MQVMKSIGVTVSDALFIALVVIVAYAVSSAMDVRDWLLRRGRKC